MVVISFSYPGSIGMILRKEKVTTIRTLSSKWENVLDKCVKKKSVDLQFYYKQRSKYGFKFLERPLDRIEVFHLEDLTEKIAKMDGGSREDLLQFFEDKYGEDYYEIDYARVFWDLDFKPPNLRPVLYQKILDFSDGFLGQLIEEQPEIDDFSDMNLDWIKDRVRRGLLDLNKTGFGDLRGFT